MKQATAKSSTDMLHKIETIEKEIMDLKLSVLKKLTPTGKKIVSLKGILKGVDITDEDIASAKRSLYSKVGI
ncbi:MAG: hypothetical protein M0Z70_11455 [Nitrospiraceae bacterium]|jgi:hypothetical protein|nr:hypothetical protein [Nitrospirota bacterium]MDA8339903.1 hypothetical protein [Nitrospiraceae bacterium]